MLAGVLGVLPAYVDLWAAYLLCFQFLQTCGGVGSIDQRFLVAADQRCLFRYLVYCHVLLYLADNPDASLGNLLCAVALFVIVVLYFCCCCCYVS